MKSSIEIIFPSIYKLPEPMEMMISTPKDFRTVYAEQT